MNDDGYTLVRIPGSDTIYRLPAGCPVTDKNLRRFGERVTPPSGDVVSDPPDLVAWLNACYDRAEQRAREATLGPWTAVGREPFESFVGEEGFYRYEIDAGESTTTRFNPTTRQHESVPCRNLVVGPGYEGGGITEAADAEHIADHDPAWRLADIGRKRKILAKHDDQHDCGDPRSWEFPYVGCTTVRLLAEEFASEPGYDAQRWAPGCAVRASTNERM